MIAAAVAWSSSSYRRKFNPSLSISGGRNGHECLCRAFACRQRKRAVGKEYADASSSVPRQLVADRFVRLTSGSSSQTFGIRATHPSRGMMYSHAHACPCANSERQPMETQWHCRCLETTRVLTAHAVGDTECFAPWQDFTWTVMQ